MGTKSVDRELEGLDNGDGTAAESAQRKRDPGRSREGPRDGAESFDWCYAQTGLRVLALCLR
jgi:hypothetical protein